MKQSLCTGAHGIIRRGNELLIVRQHPEWAPHAYWSLPGGTSEPGELLCETLEREVREEVGLYVDDAKLAWVMHEDRPYLPDQLLVFHFEVTSWSGGLLCDDPAGVVSEARFVPVPEALDLLQGEAPRKSPHTVAPLVSWFTDEESRTNAQLWNMRRQTQDDVAHVVVVAR